MIKDYLAGFGNSPRSDTIHLCKGYFEALKDEGFLKGEIIRGWTPTAEQAFSEVFSKSYGNDVALWKMLTAKFEREKKEYLGIYVIRAEVGNIEACEVRHKWPRITFDHAIRCLNKHYSPLEFVIYHSDIENKTIEAKS